MNASEQQSQLQEFMLSEVYGWQKVKLYEIKHFLFDFGGVMIEKTFTLYNLYQILESDLRIEIPLEDPYFKKIRRRCSYGILSARKFLQKLVDRYYYPNQKKDGSLPPKKVNIDYYLELWFEMYTKLTHLSSEMEEVVQRLHDAGYEVSLFSNTFDIHAKSNELKGFFDIFDHVFLSNKIGFRKPEIEKYRYVLNKLNAKPKECVFIDDKLNNLIPARDLGMVVVKFESIEKFKEQLSAMGIDDISTFSKQEILKKYEKYKLKKKEYKKAKKAYKKAKKEFLKKKGNTAEKKEEYQRRRMEYHMKKMVYKKYKEKKKEELVGKFKIDKEQ